MKVATKIFIYTVLIMTISFNVVVTINIYLNYQNSLSIFEEQALNDYYTKMYYLQNEFITTNSKGDKITEETVLNSALVMSNSISNIIVNNAIINQTTGKVIYSDFSQKVYFLYEIYINNVKNTAITTVNSDSTLLISSMFDIGDEKLVFVQGFDITHLWAERDRQITVSVIGNLIIITLTAIVLYFLAKHLTKPISQLINATNEIALGNYQKITYENGNDEITMLSKNYNIMSDCIEENVKKLEDYAKKRDDFVRDFSHELKTPLTSIIGYADILRSKKCNEERIIKLSNYIFTEGLRLENLSAQMILLMNVKQADTQFNYYNIVDIINDTIFSITPISNDKNINIKCENTCIYKVLGNKELLCSMFINLCVNAINASKIEDEIKLKVEKSQDNIIISIKDNGIGMTENDIEKITDAFYMIDSSRKGKGTGIGLSICSEIAKLHNTKLVFESEIGKGTIVKVALSGRQS